MRQRGILVFGLTDAGHRCSVVFEAANRNKATAARKLLYSLLPHDCHSSVCVSLETKQHYLDRTLAISTRIGLPVAPVKWFAVDDKMPERLEDLQVPSEILQAYLEERQEQLRKKPSSYWGTPTQRLKMLGRR